MKKEENQIIIKMYEEFLASVSNVAPFVARYIEDAGYTLPNDDTMLVTLSNEVFEILDNPSTVKLMAVHWNNAAVKYDSSVVVAFKREGKPSERKPSGHAQMDEALNALMMDGEIDVMMRSIFKELTRSLQMGGKPQGADTVTKRAGQP